MKPFKRRHVWVRNDKGKEFLNESFQKLLKREGIQFQVCRNPDIKCSIVERVQRTVRDKLYKYFTRKTRTVTSTYSRTLSAAITRRSTVRPAWLPQTSQIQTYSRYGSECRKEGARCASRGRDIASANTSESVRRRPNLSSRQNKISVRRSFELSK